MWVDLCVIQGRCMLVGGWWLPWAVGPAGACAWRMWAPGTQCKCSRCAYSPLISHRCPRHQPTGMSCQASEQLWELTGVGDNAVVGRKHGRQHESIIVVSRCGFVIPGPRSGVILHSARGALAAHPNISPQNAVFRALGTSDASKSRQEAFMRLTPIVCCSIQDSERAGFGSRKGSCSPSEGARALRGGSETRERERCER